MMTMMWTVRGKKKIELGYGVTERWYTEIGVEFEKEGESGADPSTEGIEIENKVMLTEPGEYWLDVGAKNEIFYNTSGGADKTELKLLLAKKTAKFYHLANLGAELEFGEDAESGFETSAAWSSRYRWKPVFEPGFEIHSEFGNTNDNSDHDEQKHQIGPVAYGKIGEIKYDVGYLFGATDAVPDGTIKFILEYEF